MAWSAPFTAVTGNVFTAAQWNQYGRDNLNVSEAAAAVSLGGLICATAANTVVQRTPDVGVVVGYESTASTTYVDLTTAGPAITMVHGTSMLISIGALTWNDTLGLGNRAAFALSGSNTLAAADADSYYAESGAANAVYEASYTTVRTGMTAGTTTITMKYRTTAGGGTSTFGHRVVSAVPF